jgi:hypothetical protein
MTRKDKSVIVVAARVREWLLINMFWLPCFFPIVTTGQITRPVPNTNMLIFSQSLREKNLNWTEILKFCWSLFQYSIKQNWWFHTFHHQILIYFLCFEWCLHRFEETV